MANTSRNYELGKDLLEELETTAVEEFRHRIMRLAVLDAVAVHNSVRAAYAIVWSTAVIGTALMGTFLIFFLFRSAEFSLAQLAVFVIFGVPHSVLVLRGLTRNVSPRAPELVWLLVFWSILAALFLYVGNQVRVLQAWQFGPLTLAETLGYGAIAFAAISFITMMATAVCQLAFRATTRQFLMRHSAESTAFFELLWAARCLRYSIASYGPADWAWQTTSSIQTSSRVISSDISISLLPGNSIIRQEIRASMEDSAHALSLLSKDAVLGNNTTKEGVRQQLISAAQAILSRQYSDLPCLSETDDSTRQSKARRAVGRRVVDIARGLGVAVIPLVTVKLAQILLPGLPEQVNGAIVTLAAIWLLIKIISLVDPDYKSTLTEARATIGEIKP